MTVGNYDYGLFYYLYYDGTIEVEVKLTGIVGISAFADGDAPDAGFAPVVGQVMCASAPRYTVVGRRVCACMHCNTCRE